MTHKKIRKIVFPVGGLGTRFLPATKSMPKEMLPVDNKPLIQYAFEEARNAGIEDFIFITGRNKSAINNHFDNAYELQNVLSDKQKQEELALTRDWLPPAGQIAFIRQQAPLGLGHAVWCARHFIGDEPFAVILADEVFYSERGLLSKMIAKFNETGGNLIGLAEVPKTQVHRYGIVDAAPNGHGIMTIKGMVEKPKPEEAPSNLAIIGRYILQPEIFDYLARQHKGSGGEIQLTDAMATMQKDHPFYGMRFTERRFDCGNPLGFLEANIAYAMHRSRPEVLDLIRGFVDNPPEID